MDYPNRQLLIFAEGEFANVIENLVKDVTFSNLWTKVSGEYHPVSNAIWNDVFETMHPKGKI